MSRDYFLNILFFKQLFMISGRWVEDTTRKGRSIGDIWDDYHFDVPYLDANSKDEQILLECADLSRCDRCRGKGLETCPASGCHGTGQIQCHRCNGLGKIHTPDGTIVCSCSGGKVSCSRCGGGGKIHCKRCAGCGGFLHTPILQVKWYTRTNVHYEQNSTLPEKQIEKGEQFQFWSNTDNSWTENSSIEEFLSPLQQDEAGENILLKTKVIQGYYEQSRLLSESRIRRLALTIDRLNFKEVHYNLGEKYV